MMQPLLIVPYGIETGDVTHAELTEVLLIVPYGIETTKSLPITREDTLLIVPYGIETYYIPMFLNQIEHSFNRTLWN